MSTAVFVRLRVTPGTEILILGINIRFLRKEHSKVVPLQYVLGLAGEAAGILKVTRAIDKFLAQG